MSDKEEFLDIFSFVNSMYDSTRTKGELPESGQFCWVPVLEKERRPWVADVKRSAATTHDSAELEIRRFDDTRDFRGKEARLPVHALNLTENHELILSRAKKRLCLIIGKVDGVDASTLPLGVQRQKALNAFGSQYLLAPLYAASSQKKATSFGSVMCARIRSLMYPEFFWVPKSGGVIKEDSVIRLDHLFIDPLQCGSAPENHFLSTEAQAFVMDQIQVILGETPSEEYLQVRELLVEDLPDAFK
ncbi:hypothetical protein BKP64_06365 [Marinobacter salinus]|uniref:Uncharacterized protein n=1 Tax=Marinobacter salinus TaxID=1874317 RepID=A0A1D9GJL0_9GAMM|nr:hypothetical protein [Marinobacter salinus]AOY87826.1 hypothetical protein BKP64_06365 [Marinobacter salinus]